MSETSQPAAGGQGAGALLRAERERAGVHIASLAVVLKVPVARLEALEAERFDLLPDLSFVRALAASVCRALRLDPAPVLALLPQKDPPSLRADAERPDGVTFRTPSSSSAGLGGGLRHPVVWVVGLLLAAAALLLVPSSRLGDWMQALSIRPDPGGPPETGQPAGEPPVAAVAPSGPESSDTAAVASGSSAPAVPPAATAPAEPAAAAPAATASPSLQSSTQLSAALPPPSPAGGDTIRFVASAQSWVRVTDGRGATVFEKLLQPGVAQAVGAAPPLTVVVGNARATEVSVRGQAFDTNTLTRNNVARFEVR